MISCNDFSTLMFHILNYELHEMILLYKSSDFITFLEGAHIGQHQRTFMYYRTSNRT